jgi:Protein of unknown function (DUF2380)
MYMLAQVLALAAGLSAGPQPTVAVLPLTAADPGIPYEVLPTQTELQTMTSGVRAGLEKGGVTLVTLGDAAATKCYDEVCAQKVGRQRHARYVVFGSVARLMAVWWSTELSLVDVSTGKLLGDLRVDYKGDVLSMEHGASDIGACIARSLKKQEPCHNVERNTLPQ